MAKLFTCAEAERIVGAVDSGDAAAREVVGSAVLPSFETAEDADEDDEVDDDDDDFDDEFDADEDVGDDDDEEDEDDDE